MPVPLDDLLARPLGDRSFHSYRGSEGHLRAGLRPAARHRYSARSRLHSCRQSRQPRLTSWRPQAHSESGARPKLLWGPPMKCNAPIRFLPTASSMRSELPRAWRRRTSPRYIQGGSRKGWQLGIRVQLPYASARVQAGWYASLVRYNLAVFHCQRAQFGSGAVAPERLVTPLPSKTLRAGSRLNCCRSRQLPFTPSQSISLDIQIDGSVSKTPLKYQLRRSS